MFLVILMYALFASVFTAAKIALENCQPFFLLGTRMILAGVLIFAFILIFRRKYLHALSKKHLLLLFFTSVFNIYLTNGLEFWGMQYLSTAKTSFIYSLTPFLAALLSFAVFKEKLSQKKWLGLIIGFIGFIPILYQASIGEKDLFTIGFISMAELAVIGAATCQVIGFLLMKQLIVHEKFSPLVVNCYSMFVGGILSLGHSRLFEHWAPTPIFGDPAKYFESTVWMILVSSLTCYNIYGFLLRRFTVTFLSFSGFVTPFFTAAISFVVLGEQPAVEMFLSAIVVFVGLFIFYQEELKKGIHLTPNGVMATS